MEPLPAQGPSYPRSHGCRIIRAHFRGNCVCNPCWTGLPRLNSGFQINIVTVWSYYLFKIFNWEDTRKLLVSIPYKQISRIYCETNFFWISAKFILMFNAFPTICVTIASCEKKTFSNKNFKRFFGHWWSRINWQICLSYLLNIIFKNNFDSHW